MGEPEKMEVSWDEMILSPKNLMNQMMVRCPNASVCSEVLPRKLMEEHVKFRCKATEKNSPKQENKNEVNNSLIDNFCVKNNNDNKIINSNGIDKTHVANDVGNDKTNNRIIETNNKTDNNCNKHKIDINFDINKEICGNYNGKDIDNNNIKSNITNLPLININHLITCSGIDKKNTKNMQNLTESNNSGNSVYTVYSQQQQLQQLGIQQSDTQQHKPNHSLSSSPSSTDNSNDEESSLDQPCNSKTCSSQPGESFWDLRDRISVFHIYRGQSSCLGISIVGGSDTPLGSVVVQEISKNGAVYKDGRLQVGDQLLEINGADLSSMNHLEAVRALSRPSIISQLTVYRQSSSEVENLLKPEMLSVTLTKQEDNQLGIKLIQKKHLNGIYILEIIAGGIADWDGTLRSDDLILQVNGEEVINATQEEAVRVIKNSSTKVRLLVSRIPQSKFPVTSQNRPSLLASNELDDHSVHSDDEGHFNFFDLQFMPRDKVIHVQKNEGEVLGMSIGGGLGSAGGKANTPIFITNLWPSGCLAKTNHLMKGDILLSINGLDLINSTHAMASNALRQTNKSTFVTLHILQGSETSDGTGNFTPSWKFWLAVPHFCYYPKNVDINISTGLGFSIAGGFKMNVGPMPLLVKSIHQSSHTIKKAGLRCGDLILAVNGISLDGATYGDAIRLMTSQNTEQLQLTIVSWPGSSV